METKVKSESGFRPVTVEIKLESKRELVDFYELLNGSDDEQVVDMINNKSENKHGTISQNKRFHDLFWQLDRILNNSN